jgi:hypothetical protein
MMKKTYLTICLSFLTISLFAQKLPDVQQSIVNVPANLKIDGKATEWNETFAAENKRTDLFYSMTNDDKNLYLVIKSTASATTNKIMLGGITFVVNSQGKKKEKDAPTISYPIIVRANRQQGGRAGQTRQGAQGGFQNRAQQTTAQRDSVAMLQRKTQLAGVKEIKVAGFKSITDSLISIYNEYGIKAVASIDSKGAFIYELAVPLNMLDLSASNSKEIAYQIKLNGLVNTSFGGGGGNAGGNFGGGNRGGAGGSFGGGGNASGGQDLMNPTDFWGKYMIQKK